jgi:integrase/recombinase XerD
MVTVRGAHVEVLSLPPDAAEVAAVAFLARYNGRTLDAYRQDLRSFFTWMAGHGVAVLDATRAHIELYRAWMEAQGLAAATIDRRLSTVCGFYRFAHIDGRIPANPATYVRRPKVPETIGHGMDRGELGAFLFTAERFDPMHAALAVLLGLNGLRVSEACGANIEDLGVQRGHRTLAIVGKGNKPALIPLVPRTARTIDRAVSERFEGPILCRRDGQRSIGARPTAGSRRSAGGPGWAWSIRTCCGPGSSWPRSTPVSRCATSSSRLVTPTPARPRCMTGDARTSTATPPTSSSPTSPAGDALDQVRLMT